MVAVIQRVLHGCVTVAGDVVGEIDHGLVILAAVEVGDTDADIEWMASKLIGLRIFRSVDGTKHFDRDVRDVGGGILLISNFTVAGQTSKGRRPGLSGAAPPEEGRLLFEKLISAVRAAATGLRVETGRFGADMKVSIENDGPVTFIVRSRDLPALDS